MILLERHQNVAVSGSQRSIGQVLRIHAAIGQADVVENVVDLRRGNFFADLTFNEIEQASRLFNAHSGRRSHVKNELSAVRLGEKVFAKERHKNESGKTEP